MLDSAIVPIESLLAHDQQEKHLDARNTETAYQVITEMSGNSDRVPLFPKINLLTHCGLGLPHRIGRVEKPGFFLAILPSNHR